MPLNGRRSQCNVTFEIALPGMISTITEVRYDNIASDGRGVPFPQHVLSKVKQKQPKEKALELRALQGVRA